VRSRIALGASLLLAALLLGAGQPTFQEVEESLTCQCGCGLTVHSCNHLQCGSALPLREEIRQQLAEGKDKESIIDHFRDKYGEKILSAPTTSGFNLAAWITPFVLVALGGVFIGFTIRRWGNRGGDDDDSAGSPPESSAPKEYQKILERELQQYDK
jgi:cytochrome c-type biogenesis protein CcmH